MRSITSARFARNQFGDETPRLAPCPSARNRIGVEAPVSRDRVKRRIDTWNGPAFALTASTGAVVARRNWRVFVAAT